MSTEKYALLLSYAGGAYVGWQRQKGGELSIQAAVEGALAQITGEPVKVVGSGRTDAGVHAVGQVVHCTLGKRVWEPWRLERGLNSALARDIRVLKVQQVRADFHAQRSAVSKQYSYYFYQGPCPLPHLDPFCWWIKKSLDLVALRAAVASLEGEHDFKAFQASGAKPGLTTVRTIFEAEVEEMPVAFPGLGVEGMGFVRVRLRGSGFLKQMVRGISGTLLQVGEGRRDPGCIREILASKDRSAVGATAPAKALWLERVWYPEEFGLWNPVPFLKELQVD